MRFPHDVPVLRRDDVTLRAPAAPDVAALVATYTDPLVVRWTSVPQGYDESAARDWVAKMVRDGWESGQSLAFAVESTHPDGERRCSGSVVLEARGDGRYEIGFAAHPAVRRRGVLSTAVALLLDWGFGRPEVRSVLWQAQRGNVASRRIVWREGFRIQPGYLAGWLPQRGALRDCWTGTLCPGDLRTPWSLWLEIPVVEGQRLRLRPHRDADLARIVETARDRESQYWLAFLPRDYEVDDARAFLADAVDQAVEGRGVVWAVADSDSDELLGNVALNRIQQGRAEVGYLVHPDARGRGVMTQALGLVVRHAFVPEEDGGLGLRRLVLRSALGNAASQRVARSSGFVECGRERSSEPLGDGTYDDVAVFDLLAAEYRGR